jgi:SAM-dependent methyltransferase
VSCNACGGPLRNRLPVVVDPQTRESFRIEACAACGLGHTLPQPVDLGPYYAGYHGARHGFTARFCTMRHVRFLRRAAGRPDGRRLLDVGCGDGTFLLAARDEGWQVAGTELDPAIARRVAEAVREAAHALGA